MQTACRADSVRSVKKIRTGAHRLSRQASSLIVLEESPASSAVYPFARAIRTSPRAIGKFRCVIRNSSVCERATMKNRRYSVKENRAIYFGTHFKAPSFYFSPAVFCVRSFQTCFHVAQRAKRILENCKHRNVFSESVRKFCLFGFSLKTEIFFFAKGS